MANLGNFNRADLPQDDFAALPKGTYQVIIKNSETVPYKSGNGEMLKVTYEVISDKGKGRLVWENMNLWHPTSEKAKTISWSQFGSIMDAVGVQTCQDSTELHDKPMTVDLDVDGQYNKITKWHPAKASSAPVTTAPVEVVADNANSTPDASKAPWE